MGDTPASTNNRISVGVKHPHHVLPLKWVAFPKARFSCRSVEVMLKPSSEDQLPTRPAVTGDLEDRRGTDEMGEEIRQLSRVREVNGAVHDNRTL